MPFADLDSDLEGSTVLTLSTLLVSASLAGHYKRTVDDVSSEALYERAVVAASADEVNTVAAPAQLDAEDDEFAPQCASRPPLSFVTFSLADVLACPPSSPRSQLATVRSLSLALVLLDPAHS